MKLQKQIGQYRFYSHACPDSNPHSEKACIESGSVNFLKTSVAQRQKVDADPDSTVHAHPVDVNSDPDLDPTPSFTHVGKSETSFLL
jgi:hypothetical protein